MISTRLASPVRTWSGEVLRIDGRELVLGLDRTTLEDGVALIVHLDNIPAVRAGDRVRVLGCVEPSRSWEASRVREVAGIGVHRRRWASAWSHWRARRPGCVRERRLLARRVRDRYLGLR